MIKLAFETFDNEIVSLSLRNSLLESLEKNSFPLYFEKYKAPKRIVMKKGAII